jgi:hypothetical protein
MRCFLGGPNSAHEVALVCASCFRLRKPSRVRRRHAGQSEREPLADDHAMSEHATHYRRRGQRAAARAERRWPVSRPAITSTTGHGGLLGWSYHYSHSLTQGASYSRIPTVGQWLALQSAPARFQPRRRSVRDRHPRLCSRRSVCRRHPSAARLGRGTGGVASAISAWYLLRGSDAETSG